MQTTFTKNDLNETTSRNALVRIISDAKHGGFIVVHGLATKGGHGEVSDYTFCKGISYPNAVEKSLEMVSEIENNPIFSVEVTRGTWQNANGEINPTNRKSKDYPIAKAVTKVYGHCDDVFINALAKVKMSLIAPKEPTKDYKSLGNGIYEDEAGVIYLRDLRLVSKKVIKKGDYPFSASGEETSIAEAIKREMPVGKYRMFHLGGDYEKIAIDGQEISMEGEVEQVKEDVAIAVKELVTG
jgi:hypothetical protein